MSENLKILALTKYDRNAASSRHRFLNYIPLLAEEGIDITPMPLLSNTYVDRRLSSQAMDFIDVAQGFVHRVSTLIASRRFDVLWIEGELFPRMPALAERLLKALGIPYVVDLDDAIFHTYDLHPSSLFQRLLGRKIDVVLSCATAVTAGNAYLTDRAVQAGAPRVVLVPTTIDDQAYARVERRANDKLTFGWIGSPATEHYLQTILPELRHLCHSLPARLRLIGINHQLIDYDEELRTWSEETEKEELAACDVGLAPSTDDAWAQGKCGFKAIQYMASGLPVLAAPVGALRDIVVHGETGFHYRNAVEFTALAQRLAADSELRSRFGTAGQRRVAAHYSIHNWSQTVRSVLAEASLQRGRALRPTVVPQKNKSVPQQADHVVDRADAPIREVPPRILFVISSLGLGGTERHLSLIAPALLQRGYAVSIYNLSGVSNLHVQKPLVDAGVKIISPPLLGGKGRNTLEAGLYALVSAAALLRVYVSERPTLVHFFLPEAYLIGACLARAARLPRLVMSRRSLNNYQKKHPWLATLERRLHGAMTAIVGNSQRVLDQLRDYEKAPPDKLTLIYNGIDIAHFDRHLDREEKRKQLGISDDALVLVVVANLIPYKGHADLLAAVARIKSKLPKDWVLLAVGRDDGVGSKLKKQARELGIAEHVRFIGQRHDVVELLRISNLGLVSSHEEGFCNALLEGMAAGLPIIATDVGGNAEALIDGVTGLLVPANDSEAMGDAILRLARDPSLARQMGIAGRARIEQNFSLDACVDSYDAFYRRIMGMTPRHLACQRWGDMVEGGRSLAD